MLQALIYTQGSRVAFNVEPMILRFKPEENKRASFDWISAASSTLLFGDNKTGEINQ